MLSMTVQKMGLTALVLSSKPLSLPYLLQSLWHSLYTVVNYLCGIAIQRS